MSEWVPGVCSDCGRKFLVRTPVCANDLLCLVCSEKQIFPSRAARKVLPLSGPGPHSIYFDQYESIPDWIDRLRLLIRRYDRAIETQRYVDD